MQGWGDVEVHVRCFWVDYCCQVFLYFLNVIQCLIDQNQVVLSVWVQHFQLFIWNFARFSVRGVLPESQVDQIDFLVFWQNQIKDPGNHGWINASWKEHSDFGPVVFALRAFWSFLFDLFFLYVLFGFSHFFSTKVDVSDAFCKFPDTFDEQFSAVFYDFFFILVRYLLNLP